MTKIESFLKKQFLGQTLIETVTALAVVIILVSSLVSMSIASVRSATISRNRSVASQLSYQEIERLRYLRDNLLTDWTSFKTTLSGSGCTISCNTGTANPPSVGGLTANPRSEPNASIGVDYTINLKVEMIPGTPEYELATATVSWTDSLGDHSEKITTQLTDWR